MDVDDEGKILRVNLQGGIINVPYIILDYFSSNPDILNYGRIMYKVNEEWTKLTGQAVGYSGERDFFVIAKHELLINKHMDVTC